MFLRFLPSIYLGWGLGTNDAANVFGPQVNSNIIGYRNATILTSVFLIVGAALEGRKAFSTIGGISDLALATAVIAALAAALTVNLMSVLGLPISATQAIVGSIIGLSLLKRNPLDSATLTKILVCWVLTPPGAAIVAFILYNLLAYIWQKRTTNLIAFDRTVRILSIVIGCYAAYALGANNVGNVMGTLVGANLLSPFWATILGGLSISAGVLTYSRNVMYTVGKKITPLGPFSALVAVLAEAVTLHSFAQVGVPVSSSQAVVGAVVGVGLVKGMGMINKKTLVAILLGWVLTLLGSAIAAYILGWAAGLIFTV
jgi:PiT family inorganic phosphate transporter